MRNTELLDTELIVTSPGRINLIGEHTDYNLGYVLPTAIEKSIVFKFHKNKSENLCNIYSEDYKKGMTIDLKNLSPTNDEWENYFLGVLNEVSKRTKALKGFNCSIKSSLPSGSGLSSSAALECGIASGVNKLFQLGLSKLDIIELSQKAEHSYIGTQCGIMDQFASVMSSKGNIILLDCKSLKHQQIPLQLGSYKILMLNTKVSHSLACSEYNTRRKECEAGISIIRKKYPNVSSLRDVSKEMLVSLKGKMDDVIYRRCSFIIDENDRVLRVVDALKQKDLNEVVFITIAIVS